MADSSATLSAWLTDLPKAELHLHLDGSLRPGTALELARTRDAGIDALRLDEDAMRRRLVAPERCADQAELLQAFELPVALLQDAEALERCTAELVEDVAAEGTCYVEIRWAPSLHTRRGLSLHDGIAAVVHGGRRAAEIAGIDAQFIAVALRTHSPSMAEEVASEALEFIDDGLMGFDLAGVESAVPDPTRFDRAFRLAREGGLGITCHAGEWGGAAQVRDALAVDPWRIAHGGPAADDDELMAELIRRGITLDLCPTSQRQAGVDRAMVRDALPTLLRAGVPLTISTDDRTVSGVTYVEELQRVLAQGDATTDDVVAVTRRAYQAAFLHRDEDLRARLLGRLEAWLGQHPPPA